MLSRGDQPQAKIGKIEKKIKENRKKHRNSICFLIFVFDICLFIFPIFACGWSPRLKSSVPLRNAHSRASWDRLWTFPLLACDGGRRPEAGRQRVRRDSIQYSLPVPVCAVTRRLLRNWRAPKSRNSALMPRLPVLYLLLFNSCLPVVCSDQRYWPTVVTEFADRLRRPTLWTDRTFLVHLKTTNTSDQIVAAISNQSKSAPRRRCAVAWLARPGRTSNQGFL